MSITSATNPQTTINCRVVHAYLPDDPNEPATYNDPFVGIDIAVVNRDKIRHLGDEWDQPGVYVLLDGLDAPDPNDPDDLGGTYRAYVGKATGLKSRFPGHASRRHWVRAVLVRKDGRHPFTSAHIGWLESGLYDVLHAAEKAALHNKNRPNDSTLPPYEQAEMPRILDVICRVLDHQGYLTATAPDPEPDAADDDPDQPRVPRERTSRFHGITIKTLIDAGLLTPGATLVSTNQTWPAEATVEPDGRITYRGVTFDAPSAAAVAAHGGMPTNGWDYWAVDDDHRTRLGIIRARYLDEQPHHATPGGP